MQLMRAHLSMITLLAVAAMSAGTALGAAANRGDVNGDGKVTKLDAKLLLKLVAHPGSLTPTQKTAGDLNGDGVVDIRDVRLLLVRASRA